MKVVFFHRKPRPNFNFSIESLFRQIRGALPQDIKGEVKELKFFSNGFFKRFYISLEAAFHQGDVNHVTGDINFITIFLKKKRTVLTIHDVGFMTHPNPLSRLLLKWFWIALPVKRSAFVTCVSESTRNELLKHVTIKDSRIRIIPVPISLLFVKNEKPFNKTKPRILQIGTMANKNVIRLAQAIKGINCVLEIVGDVNDDLRSALQKSGVEYVCSKNLSEKDLIGKYCESDILSFVSTYEGFGMPIVEANAVGRVVVTSNILSMPDVAGNAGHLVDPYNVASIRDGFVRVINDDRYREKLIDNGFLNRQRFDLKKITQQYVDVYRSISNRGADR